MDYGLTPATTSPLAGDIILERYLLKFLQSLVLVVCLGSSILAADSETLPPLKAGQSLTNFDQMWAGFDPRTEPLEIEVLKEWEEDGVVLRIVRFRIGVFKGQKATLAAVYGFPKSVAGTDKRLPGLVQIHGGGQYADYKACVSNAKRGYATVSIAWAGRISAPGYRVSPAEVKLFWDGKTDDPKYKVTTAWGAVDGYHAPGRNQGNHFPDAKAASWTLDKVESPRNSGWFLCALAARRALTFLEQQPEVDPDRLGVYGHSMGGKLTVMTSVDSRVKAAAPSCGGISDRYNKSPLFRATVGDDVSLKQITCPTIFLSPANDFHGRIGDLPASINEIGTDDWRVTCSPHHNHQDTAPYEVATQLWMDQHLKGSFSFPQTPQTKLKLNGDGGVPMIAVKPDPSKSVQSVDIFYTQHGKANEQPSDGESVKTRFWHHATATKVDGLWIAKLPIHSIDKPLWVYANVTYPLDQPVSGVGYYYGAYTAKTFNVSSLITMVSPGELAKGKAQATFKATRLIEDFGTDWEKEWFTYRPDEWARLTNKLRDEIWQAPPHAKLAIEVNSAEPNTLVVLLDGYAAEVSLKGGDRWQQVALSLSDFQNFDKQPLPSWKQARQLKLSPAEHLRPKGRGPRETRRVGKGWQGTPPSFRNLRWQQVASFLDFPRESKGKSDYVWTTNHMQVGVRWQPFIGKPQANAHDTTRTILANDASYAQFWVSWAAVEPTPGNQNYRRFPSHGLQAIEHAVNACNARGMKVEFVFFHCPGWATESGKTGGFKPKDGLFEQYVKRIATHFKGRVHAYQLAHEANLQGMMNGANIDFVINDVLLKGGQTIRSVYEAKPAVPVIISTTGMSPCGGCGVTEGLKEVGAPAVDHFYDLMIANPQLMKTIDALNLNVSDHASGYGKMDNELIPSVWAQYDLVRRKLDAANFRSKSVLAAESWIVWDAATNAHDIDGDGKKTEKDAYLKAITIIGQCLQRGLNTINLPWSDNSSSWAMGLVKRVDYNGRVKKLNPEIVVPARDGGPDVVTRKLILRGGESNFRLLDGSGNVFTVEDHINPSDPNHLHYYIWRWYAQISSGSDEVIRHAIAGEKDNDITVTGPGFVGKERYRIASFNRTRQHFTVLVHADKADGKSSATVTIPSKIRPGRHYHNAPSRDGFVGEGFSNGDTYYARIITKDISIKDGSDVSSVYLETADVKVSDETLTVTVPNMNRFTAIEFVKRNQ